MSYPKTSTDVDAGDTVHACLTTCTKDHWIMQGYPLVLICAGKTKMDKKTFQSPALNCTGVSVWGVSLTDPLTEKPSPEQRPPLTETPPPK